MFFMVVNCVDGRATSSRAIYERVERRGVQIRIEILIQNIRIYFERKLGQNDPRELLKYSKFLFLAPSGLAS